MGEEANALRAGEGTTGWKKNWSVFLNCYSDRLLLVLLLVLLFLFAFICGNLTVMGGLTVAFICGNLTVMGGLTVAFICGNLTAMGGLTVME